MPDSNAAVVTVQIGDTKQQFTLGAKDFKSGSRGFYGQGKVEANGKRYQANLMLVEVGSGPKAAKASKAR